MTHSHQITPIILCGGSGSRLWPLSRSSYPKQFLTFTEKKTLFQQAFKRICQLKNPLIKFNDALVVTNEEHRFLVLEQLREIDVLNAKIILEPEGRNTAPALTLAALCAIEDNQDPILIVTPSDQTIKDESAFLKSLNEAVNVAIQGHIVILGVKPRRPDTGFGYIKTKKSNIQHTTFEVLEFTEKPDFNLAKTYIDSGNYFWNSGMFIMKASQWIKAIQQFDLDIYQSTLKAYEKLSRDDYFIRPNKALFNEIPSNSIDYAVIEHCPNSSFRLDMILLDAGWNDLGSWHAVWETGEKDAKDNVVYGDVLLEGTEGSLIYSDNKLIATSGVNNLIIIETSDAILVADKNQSQKVKDIVLQLEKQKRSEQVFHRKVFRPWGWYDNLEEGLGFKVKRIEVKPGASLSLQKHHKRSEHWVVVKGEAKVMCDTKTFTLKENESTYIPMGHKHRLSNPGKDILQIIEIQTGHYLAEDDIERFEDNYGR